VEDDRDLRRLFRSALVLAGYTVSEASDGLSALRSIDQNPPDLIVLDLALPMLTGFAVLDQIQANPGTADIAVVVVTGTDASVPRVPADCVLRKPVSADRLVYVVGRCLRPKAEGSGT
jgi:CheY-like chemotaxis protein